MGTDGECKAGMDIAYNGTWGYSVANTAEPLYLALHGADRPSHEGVRYACKCFDKRSASEIGRTLDVLALLSLDPTLRFADLIPRRRRERARLSPHLQRTHRHLGERPASDPLPARVS